MPVILHLIDIFFYTNHPVENAENSILSLEIS